MAERMTNGNEANMVNWKHLCTYFCVLEAQVPVGQKSALIDSYEANLTKAVEGEALISREDYLKVTSWYESLLSMQRKEEVEYEEDKEEIEEEVLRVKNMIFDLNMNSAELLSISDFIKVLKASNISTSDYEAESEKRYMHLLFE